MTIVNFKKNILRIVSAMLTLCQLFSCEKLIELDGNPPTFITNQQLFADSATVMSAVAGVYTYSQSRGFGFSDANLTIATGLSSDELSVVDNNSYFAQFYSYTLTPWSSGIIGLWNYPYQAIYRVNDILEGVTGNPRISESLAKQITGEMKVVRALYYFYLVNQFGGVPLVTSTDFEQNAKLPRSSVETIYTHIRTDLQDAVNDLSADYPSAGRVRPNRYTAKALLSKVNLYLGDWQMAYDEADDIIGSPLYGFADVPLRAVFLEESEEAIWQLPVKTSYRQTDEAQTFIPNTGAVPRYLVTSFLLDQFENGDQRLLEWIGETTVNDTQYRYPNKYKNKSASEVPTENYMIFRLGEIILTRAEAAAHLNNMDQAIKDVNVVRKRAGLLEIQMDQRSQEDVLNAVMKERQTELCFEWGNRWFDLKRNVTDASSASTVLHTHKSGYKPTSNLYPIPQAQRDLNNRLEQNEGYN